MCREIEHISIYAISRLEYNDVSRSSRADCKRYLENGLIKETYPIKINELYRRGNPEYTENKDININRERKISQVEQR